MVVSRMAWATPYTSADAEPTTVLYNHFPSLCSTKVRIVLAEKGVAYDSRIIDLVNFKQFQPWYMRLNPNAVVPTLVHNGTVVCDSAAIVYYVNDNYDTGVNLVPASKAERADMDRLVALQDTFPTSPLFRGNFPLVMKWVSDTNKRKQLASVQRWRLEHPEFEHIYAMKVAKLNRLDTQLADVPLMAQIEADMQAILDDFDARLAKHEFLVGDSYTLADVVWTVLMARMELSGFDKWWRDGTRPNVRRYFAAMQARPSYAEAVLAYRHTSMERQAVLNGVVVPVLRRTGVYVLAVGWALYAATYLLSAVGWW